MMCYYLNVHFQVQRVNLCKLYVVKVRRQEIVNLSKYLQKSQNLFYKFYRKHNFCRSQLLS